MIQANYRGEEHVNQKIIDELDAGPVPPEAQARLDKAYSLLESTPQDRPTPPASMDDAGTTSQKTNTRAKHTTSSKGAGRRVLKRGTVVAAAAALTVLLCGSAFALSQLVQMRQGDAAFFQDGKNLPVYDSLEEGVSSLNADVGQSVQADGMTVTLENVSCDRSIVNLFFTVEQEGGFDLDSASNYEGSQESEWARLQNLTPRFYYTLVSNGDQVGSGVTNMLDAYMEDGKIKCMQRIVPEATLPDQVDVNLTCQYCSALSNESAQELNFMAGMDLSTVAMPRELGSQDLTFSTNEGEKSIGIQRFTASELGTVMVVRNDNEWSGEPMTGGSSYGPPDGVLTSSELMITDDQGNVLTPVKAGDGSGGSVDGAQVVEYANLSPEAQSVTFTPMLLTDTVDDSPSLSPEERQATNHKNDQIVDVSRIGTKLPMNEYGGYELTGWDVSDGTVSISLKPYGWLPDASIELIPQQNVTSLGSDYIDPETGETRAAQHSAVSYTKSDYRTGEKVQMDSYYAATDEELLGLTQYHYPSAFGIYREDADAAKTLAFG